MQNGDFVEIITNKSNNGPSRDWLNIVAASDTRNKIRGWFKRENREENILEGREMIEHEIKQLGYDKKALLKTGRLEEVAEKLSLPGEDDLLAAVGFGGLALRTVITKLVELHKKDLAESTSPDVSALLSEIKHPERDSKDVKIKTGNGVLVEGESGYFVRLAKCCNPIPGDEISGG